MASRPKTKPPAEPAKPSRLGNDPFQRGAAPAAVPPRIVAEEAKPEPAKAVEQARPETKLDRPKSKPGTARPKTEPTAKTAARPKTAEVKKAESPARPTTAEVKKAESPARPKTAEVKKAARPKTAEAKPVAPRPETVQARKPRPATPVAVKPPPIAPEPVVREPVRAEPVVEAEPAALVRHVHVPEVDHDEAPPRAEPQPEPKPQRTGMLAQFAMAQVQSLAGKLLASPSALQTAAAAISGATAVRALMARPDAPRTVDDFGEDPALVARAAPTIDFLYRHYFRVSVDGGEHLPRRGPLLCIANHAGALPLDGPIVRSALERTREDTRARWLVEDALFHAPFVGTVLNRLGAVRACPENAQRLLEGGAALVVFPEGVNALTKTFRRRYQLQRFGRGGFVKLALRTGAPLVPTAVLGAEESMPILATLSAPSLGLPVLPLTPALLPLPTKWQVTFLPPVDLSKYGPDDANDLSLVQRITEEVRTAIHDALEQMRAERRSVFRG